MKTGGVCAGCGFGRIEIRRRPLVCCRIDGDADSGSGGVRGGYASLLFRMCGSTTDAERAEHDGGCEVLWVVGNVDSGRWQNKLETESRTQKSGGSAEVFRGARTNELGELRMRMSRVGGYEAGDKEAWAGKSFEVKSGKIWACYSLVATAHGMQQENGQIALHPNTSGQLDVAVVTRS
jgi:hypothetical protein